MCHCRKGFVKRWDIFLWRISYSLLNTTLISPYPKDIRDLTIYETPLISLGLIKKYPCQFSLVEIEKYSALVKDSDLDPRSIFERNVVLSSGGITERSCKITNKIIPEDWFLHWSTTKLRV